MNDVTVLHILKCFHNWCIKTKNWFDICFLQFRSWKNNHKFFNPVSRTMSWGMKSEVSLPNVLWLQLTAVQGLCIQTDFLVLLSSAWSSLRAGVSGLAVVASAALAALHGRTEVGAGEKLQSSPRHTQTLPTFRTVQAGMSSLVMGGTCAFPHWWKPPEVLQNEMGEAVVWLLVVDAEKHSCQAWQPTLIY